jgi:hypothetical protein
MAGATAIASPSQLGDEPVYAFGRERRMHARAYDYWVSLLNGRRMPCVTDLDPEQIADFADRSVLVDLPAGGGSPLIAHLGRELRDESDVTVAHPTLADVPQGTLLAELLRRFSDIVAHEAPVGFEAEFAGRADTRLLHRGILLPLANDRGELGSVFGVMSWKQVAAVEPAPDILAAVGNVAALRASAPVVCAWGDGPGAALTVTESLPPQPLDQQLASARTWAALAVTDRMRGDSSLHAALSAAYDYGIATNDPSLTSLKLVQLVFGEDLRRLDRVRYAAVLDHAIRLGLGPSRVGPWLDSLDGGHVAAARAERRIRRLERHAAEAGAGRDWAEAQPALGTIELAVDEDLMLMIGRRAPHGVDVIASVPADDLLIGAALTRARLAR